MDEKKTFWKYFQWLCSSTSILFYHSKELEWLKFIVTVVIHGVNSFLLFLKYKDMVVVWYAILYSATTFMSESVNHSFNKFCQKRCLKPLLHNHAASWLLQ